MLKCRTCGKKIEFIKTERGGYMPVEPKSVYGIIDINSTFSVLTLSGKLVRVAEVPAGTERAIKGWIPHFQKCEDTVAFRKARAEARKERQAREEAARLEAMKPKQISMFGGRT